VAWGKRSQPAQGSTGRNTFRKVKKPTEMANWYGTTDVSQEEKEDHRTDTGELLRPDKKPWKSQMEE
jgi:hypothetical protein